MSDPGTNNQAQPHYPRRPERPKTDLNSPDWKARIASVTGWVEKIVENDEQLLHIGAIWGPRGSGKTSFLKTLCKQLPKETRYKLRIPAPQPKNDPHEKKDATEESPRVTLFAPDLIDDHSGTAADHLFTHLLHFIEDNHYFKQNTGKVLKPAQELLTEHRYKKDFEKYNSETAASAEELTRLLHERLSDHATFSTKLRKAIREAIREACNNEGSDAARWFLLLIDDIDLVPHRGPELLTLLHLYLRDLPFIVILAADREQLVEHTATYLEKLHQRRDRNLALNYVAKQVPYEWFVPQPSAKNRLKSLFDRDLRDKESSPEQKPLGEELEKFFEDAKNLLGRGWKRTEGDSAETTKPEWLENVQTILYTLLPLTWRGVNRTYNRLATLLETKPDLGLRVHPKFRIPLIISLVAVDEHIPQLALWDALTHDPEDLLKEIPRPLTPIQDDGNRDYNRDYDDNSSEPQPSSSATQSAHTIRPAPLDRLNSQLKNRDNIYATKILTTLGSLIAAMRMASSALVSSASDKFTVIALTLTRDIRTNAFDELNQNIEGLEDLFDPSVELAFDSEPDHHIDLQEVIRNERPTAGEITVMIRELDRFPQLDQAEGDLALYPRAPLSLLAWFGWQLRQRPSKTGVIGLWNNEFSFYEADKKKIDHTIDEPFHLDSFELSFDSSLQSHVLKGQALVVVDVRSKPDLSSRALPLFRDDRPVRPEYAHRIASDPGFQLTPENLLDVLCDVLWLFRSLKNGRGIERYHLALSTPAPLAFFIGREIHSFIPIDLYEHDPSTSSYRYVTTLE